MITNASKTIFNLSLDKNLLTRLILCNQKNAAPQDLDIWADIEKLESNQDPRLRTAEVCLISIVPTRIVQGLIFKSCCLDPIINNDH